MASEQRPGRLVYAGAILLALAAWSAAAAPGMAVRGVASGAGAVAGLLLIRRGLARAAQLPPLEVAVRLAPGQAGLADRALGLESQLEHAPIALFRILPSRHNAVEPVNASARRLLAPGRASDVPALHRVLAGLAIGQRSVVEFETERGAERALATANAMTVDGEPQRLAALMPMEDELEAEAMQAWQKLVHVLTHEIMNSLTPVASLSQTSRDLLKGAGSQLPADIAVDLDIALEAITRRADSLARFVGGYRSLASVPEAMPQRITVSRMFARLSALVAPGWQARGGRAVFHVESESLELMADPGQLEQALVNLLQNAAEACAGQATPEVRVSARLARGGRLHIAVSDNGPGVQDELIADIFTPFFSTREKGSGIGLAMVRQLVHRNGGAVRYARSVGGGARFIITF